MFKKKTDKMTHNSSPDIAPKNSGVRRVNSLPLVILGSFILGISVTTAISIMSRSNKQVTAAETAPTPQVSAKTHAEALVGDRKYGLTPAALEQTTSPQTTQKNPSTRDLNPPQNNQGNQLQKVATNDELEKIRALKMQQLDEAVKAKTKVQISLPKTTAVTSDPSYTALSAANRSNDPTAAYQTQLAQLQGTSASGSGAINGNATPQLLNVSTSTEQASSASNSLNQFAVNDQNDRWRLDSRPEAPRTPYELRAGFVLPATLISGINSELPGQIMGQVAQNVYDTPTGKHLLIPQGSRLVGTYSSDVAYGQSRVLVAWQRIVFPDGKAMDIGAMPGSDSAGYSGFNDQVNNHYVRIFGSAIMMSAITAGFAYSQDENEDDYPFFAPTASSELSAALGQQLGDVAAQMIEKNLNIAPTLEIRPGYRFNVMVTKDMTFSHPYQSFDY